MTDCLGVESAGWPEILGLEALHMFFCICSSFCVDGRSSKAFHGNCPGFEVSFALAFS